MLTLWFWMTVIAGLALSILTVVFERDQWKVPSAPMGWAIARNAVLMAWPFASVLWPARETAVRFGHPRAMNPLVLRSFLAMEREDRLARGVDAGLPPPPGQGEPAESVSLGFRRAIEEIRSSRLGAGGLDALPWILMLGESGAGKTAALRESQLAMPAEYATRVTGAPTASCDWWLTNHAIVLDLAGRYLEQKDEESEAEWRDLLRLIRKSRSGVAANGLIFAISVESLLTQSSSELEDRARALRRRLNEATDELGMDLPIYVLVTKLDQVEGFVEAVAASPVIRPDSAFGWTNDQRILPDPEQPVIDGMAGVIARLEGVLPELLLRERANAYGSLHIATLRRP